MKVIVFQQTDLFLQFIVSGGIKLFEVLNYCQKAIFYPTKTLFIRLRINGLKEKNRQNSLKNMH